MPAHASPLAGLHPPRNERGASLYHRPRRLLTAQRGRVRPSVQGSDWLLAYRGGALMVLSYPKAATAAAIGPALLDRRGGDILLYRTWYSVSAMGVNS